MFQTIPSVVYLLLSLCVIRGTALCTQGSYLNLCGYCVGGTTDKTDREGLDRCEICDGQGDCVGCDGIINSPRRRDICGLCMPPQAEQWNDCRKIDDVYPSVLDLSLDGVLIPLTITGAGLTQTDINTIQCYILPLENQLQSPTVKEISLEENYIQIKILLGISTGTYKIGCSEIEGFVNLLLVDSRNINVIKVNVLEISVDVATELQIEVENDRNSTENIKFWCFVREPDGGIQTLPAVFRKTNQFSCSEYTATTPGIFSIGLVAHEDAAFGENTTGRTVDFHARAKSPVAENGEYTPDMQRIAITFDQNIDIMNCNGTFSPENEKSLGKDFTCTAIGDILYVTLGEEPEVLESITIMDVNSIRRAGSSDLELSPNAGGVTLPLSKDKVMMPRFSLSLPNAVCADKAKQPVIKITVPRLGQQKLEHTWTVPPGRESRGKSQRENMAIWKHARSVESELNNITQRYSGNFFFNRTNLLPGFDYILNLRSKNAFGDERGLTASMKIPEEVNVSVAVTAFPSTSTIAAEASITFCTDMNQSTIRYKWRVNDNVVSEDGKLLIIPKSKSGTYNISCTILKHRTSQVLGAGWTLTEIVEVAQRVIIFPAETVVGTMDDIILRAYPTNIQLRWSCTTSFREPCMTVGPNAYPVDDLVNITSPIIRIPAGVLPVGRYIWTLHGDDQAEATVAVSPKIPPLVKITPSLPDIDSIKPLSLNAEIERLMVGCRIRWRTIRKRGYDYFDLQKDVGLGDSIEINIDDLETSEREAPLIIPTARGNWKGLTGGALYLFRLETRCPSPTPEAHTDVTLVTNAPPSYSDIRVTPETGEAIRTKFSIQLSEGHDSIMDYPLIYRLSCKDESGDEVTLGESLFTSFQVSLPPGNITLIVKTCDIRNSCSRSTMLLEVQHLNAMTTETIRSLSFDVKNDMLCGDTLSAYGKAIVAFKSLSTIPGFQAELDEILATTEAAVRDRLTDLKEQLHSNPKLIKSSFKFLEQSVTSLKYFPETKEMVKILTEFKNLITKPAAAGRTKRETDGVMWDHEANLNIIKAFFELHARNLENDAGNAEVISDVAGDLKKYMVQLCLNNDSPLLIDFPALALRVSSGPQRASVKELPVADVNSAKLVLNWKTISPKSCVATMRYSTAVLDDSQQEKGSQDIYEIRVMTKGNFESGKVKITLPVSNEASNEKCILWETRSNATACNVELRTVNSITCLCNGTGFISVVGETTSTITSTPKTLPDAVAPSESIASTNQEVITSDQIVPTNNSEFTPLIRTIRDSAEGSNDVKVNENTIKAIFDLHGKILEQNNTESNTVEFLKDVRKYMVEACLSIQDSSQGPMLIEASVVTLAIIKLTQNEMKKDLSVSGIPNAKIKLNLKSLSRKTCAAIAKYHKDFFGSTTTFRASDLYEVRFIKNGTFKYNSKDEIKSLVLTLPLYNSSHSETVECVVWSDEKGWKPMTTLERKAANEIACGCKDLGIFSAFASNKTIREPAVPLTSAATTSVNNVGPTAVAGINVTTILPTAVNISTTTTTTVSTPLHTNVTSMNVTKSTSATTTITTTSSTTIPTPVTTTITIAGTSKNTTYLPTGSSRTLTTEGMKMVTPLTSITITTERIVTSVIQHINLSGNSTRFYISGTFKIDEDYAATVGKNITSFKESLKTQISEQLKISPNVISDVIIKQGSILVTVLFVDTEEAKADVVIQSLVTKLHEGNLRLISQNGTVLNVPRQELKIKIGAALTRNTGRVRLITYGVVGGTILTIFIVAVGATYFKRKRTRMPLRLPRLSIDDHPTYRQFHNEFSLDGSSATLARYRRDYPFETETIQ